MNPSSFLRNFAKAFFFSLCRYVPSISTSLVVGVSIVEIILSRVVFPLPDGPIIATNSPFSISKLILDKARNRGRNLFPFSLRTINKKAVISFSLDHCLFIKVFKNQDVKTCLACSFSIIIPTVSFPLYCFPFHLKQDQRFQFQISQEQPP
jgi:hypothetical protein